MTGSCRINKQGEGWRIWPCVCVCVCVCYSSFMIGGYDTSLPLIPPWNSLPKTPLGNSFSYIYTISIMPLNWYLYLLNWQLYSSLGEEKLSTQERHTSKVLFYHSFITSLFSTCQGCHNTSDAVFNEEWLMRSPRIFFSLSVKKKGS